MATKREMYQALLAYAERHCEASPMDPAEYIRWIASRDFWRERLLMREINSGPPRSIVREEDGS